VDNLIGKIAVCKTENGGSSPPPSSTLNALRFGGHFVFVNAKAGAGYKLISFNKYFDSIK
jgi:hypothetical protein